jgi:hypothetical protein
MIEKIDQEETAELAKTAEGMIERIKPIFAGHSPELQGMVLSELTAIWLSGFKIKGGNDDAQMKLWSAMFNVHMTTSLELLKIYSLRDKANEDGSMKQ